jgi:transposase-like protein
MESFTAFDSLISLISYFKNEKVCREYLIERRWGKQIACPHCGGMHCYVRGNGRIHCNDCGSDFSVKVGTIFENTKLPLMKWFMAMYLISCHKKGISSLQLSRDINVTQKTAWFMLQKIRTLYAQDKSELFGDVECDETYIGGKETNKHESKKVGGTQGRSTKTKSGVFGMVERNSGNIAAMRIPDSKANTLTSIINLYVKKGSRIFTDEYIGYHSLKDSESYEHLTVNHKDKEFVRDDSHTNTIEGFWCQLKRMVMGVYHFMSAKYLQRYIDEAVFRYNTCRDSEGERFRRMFDMSIGVVSYKRVRMVA